MSEKDPIAEGLAAFKAGEMRTAARFWVEARDAGLDNQRLRAYLRHLEVIDPGALRAAEHGNIKASGQTAEGRPPSPSAVQPPAEPVGTSVDLRDDLQGLHIPADPWGPAIDAVQLGVGADGAASRLSDPSAPFPEPPAVQPAQLASYQIRLKERMDLHDFSGALDVAEQILAAVPDHAEACIVRAECVERLEAMSVSKLGDLQRIPRVKVADDEVVWLDLDHRSGFVLAQVDGMSSYEEIIAVTGMDRLESVRVLAKLVGEGIIG